MRFRRPTGFIIALALAVLVGTALFFVFLQAGAAAAAMRRERSTDEALAQAREALIVYAAERPMGAAVGPGFLPCPDLDDDGWAESTCGSLSGDRGQEQRLGRLPWKTLGLPDIRDGHGERLWYAVSTRFKGLLNCAASAACVELTPATALGTITVRDATGAVVLDGTSGDPVHGGAAAVVIAPGGPLARQRRECSPRACAVANYLDAAPPERSGEDNADFHDRSDGARVANGNGFIEGPVTDASGRVVVNDRIAAITPADLMPRVMRRVALEVAHCISFYASRPENAGRLPHPTPACARLPAPAFGRVPDTPFPGAVERGMLERWWRAHARTPEALDQLPTQAQACRLAAAPQDNGAVRSVPPPAPADEGETAGRDAPAWWPYWRPFVFYAPAAPGRPIEIVDVDSRVLARDRRFAVVVSVRGHECESPRLECDAAACSRVIDDDEARDAVVVAVP